jgi:hypothetical protein
MYIFMDGIVRKLISAGTDHLASRGSLAVDHQNHYRFLELKTRPYSLHRQIASLLSFHIPRVSRMAGRSDTGTLLKWWTLCGALLRHSGKAWEWSEPEVRRTAGGEWVAASKTISQHVHFLITWCIMYSLYNVTSTKLILEASPIFFTKVA